MSCDHLPQPEIAFLLALFLTVGELHLLLGKIYFGKDAYDKDDDGNRRDKPLTAAIKQLLIILSAPDSIIVRSQEEGGETWLAPKYEQAFAIYENLRENYPIDSEKQIPEQYMMHQLLLFIEHHNILEGCRFARTKTTLTEGDSLRGNDLLTQEITFENDKRYPYHIRLNTIRGRCRWKEKNDDLTTDCQPAIESEGTFSLKLLMAIVAVYLKNNKAQDINKFVTNWFETNKDYGHRTLATKSQETLPKRIEERLKHLIREQEKPPRNLHAQIRFICHRINHIWRQQHGASLSKHEYKILEDKVRYFNKDELRDHLESIWQKTGIGLGRDNDKALGNAITKDRLQDVYSDLSDAWIDYLKDEQERLSDEISDDALQQITTNIGFRKSKSEDRNKPDFPVGLPPKKFKCHFIHDFVKPKREFGLYQSINRYWKITLQDKPTTVQRAEWYKQTLLFAMIGHSTRNIIDVEKLRVYGTKLSPLSEQDIQINIGNKHVTMNFNHGCRKYAKLSTEMMDLLATNYIDSSIKFIPLLRANEVQKNQSIESAIQKSNQERLTLIEASLAFETDWREKNQQAYKDLSKGEGGEVNFSDLCKAAGLENVEDNAEFRNKALHNDILYFSNCPQPLKSLYQEIMNKQARKQNDNKSKFQNKHR